MTETEQAPTPTPSRQDNQEHGQAQLIHTSTSYGGPFPPPVLLREFEDILPGAAERIFKFSEREQQHRHETEKTQVDALAMSTKANTICDIIGRVFGMLFLLFTFAAALHFSFVDKSIEFAALFYSPSIVFALAVLIKGRRK